MDRIFRKWIKDGRLNERWNEVEERRKLNVDKKHMRARSKLWWHVWKAVDCHDKQNKSIKKGLRMWNLQRSVDSMSFVYCLCVK